MAWKWPRIKFSEKWSRAFYIASYVLIIIGIGLSLLVTGYDLVQQTLALAKGGAQYFYIFILVGAYVATVRRQAAALTSREHFLGLFHWRDFLLFEKLCLISQNDTCQSRNLMSRRYPHLSFH